MTEREGKGRQQRLLTTSERLKLSGTASRFKTAACLLQQVADQPVYGGELGELPHLVLAELRETLAAELNTILEVADRALARSEAAGTTPEPGAVTCSGCDREALPGLRVCFNDLWIAGTARPGVNTFPLGSPEPGETVVGRNTYLVGENGVWWSRDGGKWLAGGSAGDQQSYSWRQVNGSDNDTGRELVRYLPEYAR